MTQQAMFGHHSKPVLHLEDGRVVDATGREHSPVEAAQHVRWTTMTCPQMPHQYAGRRDAHPLAWAVLSLVASSHPQSFEAYFRGYQRPNRYVDLLDGNRYWITNSRNFVMLNRAPTAEVHMDHRRVDEGARPDPAWGTAPWAPKGSDLYRFVNGAWWPKPDAPFKVCAACRGGPR